MIDFTNIKTLEIPEGSVKKIEANGGVLWEKSGYTNQIPKSIDSNGKPYNGGLGYKAKTRLSTSTGSESESENATSTGFIPAKGGDVVRIWDFLWGETGASSNNAIVVYTSNFTYLGSTVWNGTNRGTGACASMTFSTSALGYIYLKDATVTLIDNPNIAYIRVCSCGNNGDNIPDGANAIITVNEEIV